MTQVKMNDIKNTEVFDVIPVQPTAPNAKGGNTITVASMEQQSLRCSLYPFKNYDVIIAGTNTPRILITNYTPSYGLTQVLVEDWEWITKQPKYMGHPSFKNKRVFAQKNEQETRARAEDSESQELSKLTGSAQLTSKDLVASAIQSNSGSDGGVTDAQVKSVA